METNEKISAEELQGVSETALAVLYARAIETQKPDGIISDFKAVEFVQRIDYDFSKFEDAQATIMGVAVRTEILDEYVSNFIQQHPQAVIVNVGAGLDTRFTRLDNGEIMWYELDLQPVLTLRHFFFEDTERYRMIGASALDFRWMNKIERREHTLFIIEGLLMYFVEQDVKNLMIKLAHSFPNAEVLAEVMGWSQSQRTEQSDAISKTNAKFKWGIRYPEEITTWDEHIVFLDDISVYDRHAERWLAMPLNWVASLQDLRKTVNRIVHLRFEASET